MSKPYKPGAESAAFFKLPKPIRDSVIAETNRRFTKETGVTRQLDPSSAADLELRRTWLRLRDDVMQERWAEEDAEARHEMDVEAIDAIPDEMRNTLEWPEAATLLETWFGRPASVAPKYSAPVTDVIKMDWVLRFPRAKEVYDAIFKEKIWTNSASQGRMKLVLKSKSGAFGDLSRAAIDMDNDYINARPVENGLNYDAMSGALGAFVFKLAVAGIVLPLPAPVGGMIVTVQEIGIYVKDSFDFNGDQFLGFWGYRDTPTNNSDFREWRNSHHQGGDFEVFSDVKRTKLSTPDVVKVAP